MRITPFVVSSLIATHAPLVAAQPTPPPAAPPPAQEPRSTTRVSGVVVGYTTTPRGEMDGIVLDSGITVHFPPEAGSQLSALVAKGQRVTVRGMAQHGAAGQVLEATKITNDQMRRSIDVSSIAPQQPPHGGMQGPPPPGGPEAQPPPAGPEAQPPPSSTPTPGPQPQQPPGEEMPPPGGQAPPPGAVPPPESQPRP